MAASFGGSGRKGDRTMEDKKKEEEKRRERTSGEGENGEEKTGKRESAQRGQAERKAGKKEPKRKPKYGMLSCVAYMYKMMWEQERGLAITGVCKVPAELFASVVTLYTPPLILSLLEGTDRFSVIALVITGLVTADMLSRLAGNLISSKTEYSEFFLACWLNYRLRARWNDRDFFLKYDPEIKKLDERAGNAAGSNHSRGVHFLMEFPLMVAVVLKFLFFSSVLSMLSPWIILLVAAGSIANIPLSAWERRRNYETQDKRNAIAKKLGYLAFWIGRDFKYGKDIRLYSLRGYLGLLAKRLMGEYSVEKKKVEGRISLVQFADFLVIFCRDALIYAWLISRAAAGEIDAAGFVLYFTAVTELAETMGGIRWWWSCVCEGALQISDYRECMEIPDRMNRGEGIQLPKGAFRVEFKDVTYRYPGTEKNVLEHISFTLEAGEKLALVGANGAGKTTLIRLMCGLLLPTEGEVLIDGHRLLEYNRDELYGLFGLVPQDYHLLPVSIARNVACTDEGEGYDREKLERCLALAGLEEKVGSLPLGVETPLNRQVNPGGVELSGGETQKLLLARLLYRRPQCVILDEPTAALDPLAEDRMYRSYNEITAGSTAVFISHRLASTRFCDRIFLLDGTVIAEEGTHEELMAAGRKYREIFDVQSRYYNQSASKG